jgi:hypothetical protein
MVAWRCTLRPTAAAISTQIKATSKLNGRFSKKEAMRTTMV